MLRLPNMDAALLHGETPEMPIHTMGVLVLEKPAGGFHERLGRMLEKRLHLVPALRHRLIGGAVRIGDPYWIRDPDFDLSNHMFRSALPAPGGMDELHDFAARVAGRLLDRSRPLWELHVVEGMRDGSVALIVKIHHALMDGMKLVGVMEALLDPMPRGRRIPPPLREWTPEQEPSLGRKVLSASGSLLARPYHLARSVREIRAGLSRDDQPARAPANGSAATARARIFNAPPTPFNGRLSTLRSVGTCDVALDSLKRIRASFGTSVNDVVLAAGCAALRAWLLEHEAMPQKPLLTAVPVAQRIPGSATTHGNHISMIFIDLPVRQPDPVARLHAIREQTVRAKRQHVSTNGDVLRQTADLLLNLFLPSTLSRIMSIYSGTDLSNRIAPPWNLIISNVPGPREALYCAGARVRQIYPFGPLLLGSGINFTVISAMGRLHVGALACRRMMPDVSLLTNAFAEEIICLENAASA